VDLRLGEVLAQALGEFTAIWHSLRAAGGARLRGSAGRRSSGHRQRGGQPAGGDELRVVALVEVGDEPGDRVGDVDVRLEVDGDLFGADGDVPDVGETLA
jgi:hypothetical protein